MSASRNKRVTPIIIVLSRIYIQTSISDHESTEVFEVYTDSHFWGQNTLCLTLFVERLVINAVLMIQLSYHVSNSAVN